MSTSTHSLARVGLGLAALGRPAYINVGRADQLPPSRDIEAMRGATHEVLDAAYQAGVRWIDTARSYGLAEEFLADWLTERRPEGVTVSSKWGYAYVGGWRLDAEVHEAKEHSLARFRAQWTESRERLGDVLALYQVHSLTADSPLFDDQALVEAMAALADEGVRVGFSTSGPAQADTIRRAFELTAQGCPVFTSVQSTWNLLEQSAGDALAEAAEAGNSVLVKETLANGRLVVDPPPVIAAFASDRNVTPDAVAVAAVLAQPWASTVLVGPASTAQLASNLRGAGLDLGAGDLALLCGFRESAGGYWANRSSLRWQ
ncbi:aldo/keto reductase [Amycolatopsis sp. cg5]|uniref:aldo/keto reductase n=1 Tax=Amycolatopsis sp. cg5 TaxID=3238802 RepID=UPI00352422BF